MPDDLIPDDEEIVVEIPLDDFQFICQRLSAAAELLRVVTDKMLEVLGEPVEDDLTVFPLARDPDEKGN